jgi:hypothetical protein
VAPDEWPRVERIVREWAVPVAVLGRVGGDRLAVRVDGTPRLAVSLDAMAEAFTGCYEALVGGVRAEPTEGAA